VNAKAAAAALALAPSTETFGQPETNTHLIAKLRQMPADRLAYVMVPTTTRDIHLPKERP
jgi:hypothetical protein